MWEYVEQAGVIGYILVGFSVLSGGVILERLWFWMARNGKMRPDLKMKLVEAFRQGNRQRVGDLVKSAPKGPQKEAVKVLYSHWGAEDDSPVEIAVNRAVSATNRWLMILDVNGTVAPMLGILGTVVGVIQAFEGMHGTNPDPRVMVSGISVSMLTTAIGLIVALFSIIPYNVFAAKAHRYQTQLAEFLQECWMISNGSDKHDAEGTQNTTKSRTPNPEPETRNPEPKTRNPEPRTRNPEPRTPAPERDTRK